jgi:molybdenum cofactor biosynthesis protein B
MAAFVALRLAVLTVSDTRTAETDRSGSIAAEHLLAAGHEVIGHEIVRDDVGELRAAFGRWTAPGAADVVVATGGTGVTARDVTPEALAPLVTKPIPGFGELFRTLSYAEIGAATIQSRAEAALCGGALVFLLPGSPRAVALAMDKIVVPQLDGRTRPCNFAELLPRIRGSR